MGRKAALARMAGLHLMLIFTIAVSTIPGNKARPAVQRRIDDVSSLARLVSALIWDELLQQEELRSLQLQTPLDRMLEDRAALFNGIHKRQSKLRKNRNYGVKGDLIPYPRTGRK